MRQRVCPTCSTEYPAGVERCPRDGKALVWLEPTYVRSLQPEPIAGTEPDLLLTPAVRAEALRAMSVLPPSEDEPDTRPHVSFELPPEVKAALAASLAPSGTFQYGALPREGHPPDTRPVAPPAERTPVVDPLLGATVGEYLVKGRLGEGGMGIVYEAVHPLIGKRVALKCLKREVAANPEDAVRLLSEARAANTIGHRGIIDIFGFGTLPDGRQYFAMELLSGEPLDQRLAQGPVEVAEALALLEEVLEPLAAAHAAGVVHRDLKPSNIFVVTPPSGHRYVKLLDFGLALKLETDGSRAVQGQLIGTPNYMAPEQVRGEAVTARTDLYAVGVIAWEMLVGRAPFEGKTPWETLKRHLHETPPVASAHAPGVPPALDALIARLLARNPADRPPTADIVRAELKVLRRNLQANDTFSSLPAVGPFKPLEARTIPERRAPDTDKPEPPAGSSNKETDPAVKAPPRAEGTDEVPALKSSSAQSADTQPRFPMAPAPQDTPARPLAPPVPVPVPDFGETVRAPAPPPPALNKESPSRVRRTASGRDTHAAVTQVDALAAAVVARRDGEQRDTRITPRPSRRRWPVILGVVVVLAAAALLGWFLG